MAAWHKAARLVHQWSSEKTVSKPHPTEHVSLGNMETQNSFMNVRRTSFRREVRKEDAVMQFHLHVKEKRYVCDFKVQLCIKERQSALRVAAHVGGRTRTRWNRGTDLWTDGRGRTQRAREDARGGIVLLLLLPPRPGGAPARPPPKRAPLHTCATWPP